MMNNNTNIATKFSLANLKKEVSIRVKVFGIIKNITFKLNVFEMTKSESENLKSFVYETTNIIEVSELNRIANEFNFPFKAKNAVAYPKGKSSKDFIIDD
ncbi:MAG: hypothetical protein QXO21_03025 [Candidatus Anstonellales archaeon]